MTAFSTSANQARGLPTQGPPHVAGPSQMQRSDPESETQRWLACEDEKTSAELSARQCSLTIQTTEARRASARGLETDSPQVVFVLSADFVWCFCRIFSSV